MTGREHFMPASLLDSQLATMEPLDLDEHGGTVETDQPVDRVIADALDLIRNADCDGAGRG